FADLSLLQGDSQEEIDGFGVDDYSSESDVIIIPSALDFVSQDEMLTPLGRLDKYVASENIFNRQMVARSLLDTLKAVSEDERDCIAVLERVSRLAEDSEPTVRAELMEQVPHIAIFCQENRPSIPFAFSKYLLPIVVRYLADQNNQVRKTSQAALLVLLEQELIERDDVETKVCPVLVDLTAPDSNDDVKTEAMAIICKMAPMVGKDITERLFLPRFCEMCCDCRMFHVRKVCAANFGDICSVVGREATEELLLPRFFQLCSDNVWGVRKACAECFMTVSSATSQEVRRTKLSSLFINLISDPSRWVRQAAFQSLGQFISTFASPSGSGQCFKEEDEGAQEGCRCVPLQSRYPSASPRRVPRPARLESARFPTRLAPPLSSQRAFLALKREEKLFLSLEQRRCCVLSSPQARTRGQGRAWSRGWGCASQAPRRVVGHFRVCERDSSVLKQKPILSIVPIHNIMCKKDTTVFFLFKVNHKLQMWGTEFNSNHNHSIQNRFNRKNMRELEEMIENLEPHTDDPDVKAQVDVLTAALRASALDSHQEDTAQEPLDSRTEHSEEGGSEDPFAVDTVPLICDSAEIESREASLQLSHGEDSELSDSSTSPEEDRKSKQQDVVPQALLDQYLSMTDPSRAQTVDTEIAKHCAYSLPGVALTLGRQNWHCLRDTYETLASDMQWKVRRTLAFSIHELAVILGDQLTAVRIGVLKHLYDFLKLLHQEKRREYLYQLQEFLVTDNSRNWRFRAELAEQLVLLLELYGGKDVYDYLRPLAFNLCTDRVSSVRWISYKLVSEIIRKLSSDVTLLADFMVELVDKFCHSPKWSGRQAFAFICQLVIEDECVSMEQFSEYLLPPLLQLVSDPVPNVRVLLAKTLRQTLLEKEYFVQSANSHQEALEQTLVALQMDLDKDVKYFASVLPGTTRINDDAMSTASSTY
uniref:Serine/threonine-protein phosphatase 4 regulatory subunit 1 n=1 Tax=Lepisosteus oculatus TaxID=7918 RepID=W5M3I6_LEPOC